MSSGVVVEYHDQGLSGDARKGAVDSPVDAVVEPSHRSRDGATGSDREPDGDSEPGRDGDGGGIDRTAAPVSGGQTDRTDHRDVSAGTTTASAGLTVDHLFIGAGGLAESVGDDLSDMDFVDAADGSTGDLSGRLDGAEAEVDTEAEFDDAGDVGLESVETAGEVKDGEEVEQAEEDKDAGQDDDDEFDEFGDFGDQDDFFSPAGIDQTHDRTIADTTSAAVAPPETGLRDQEPGGNRWNDKAMLQVPDLTKEIVNDKSALEAALSPLLDAVFPAIESGDFYHNRDDTDHNERKPIQTKSSAKMWDDMLTTVSTPSSNWTSGSLRRLFLTSLGLPAELSDLARLDQFGSPIPAYQSQSYGSNNLYSSQQRVQGSFSHSRVASGGGGTAMGMTGRPESPVSVGMSEDSTLNNGSSPVAGPGRSRDDSRSRRVSRASRDASDHRHNPQYDQKLPANPVRSQIQPHAASNTPVSPWDDQSLDTQDDKADERISTVTIGSPTTTTLLDDCELAKLSDDGLVKHVDGLGQSIDQIGIDGGGGNVG